MFTGFSPTKQLIIHVIHPLTMSRENLQDHSSSLCVGSPRPQLWQRSQALACSLSTWRIFLFHDTLVAMDWCWNPHSEGRSPCLRVKWKHSQKPGLLFLLPRCYYCSIIPSVQWFESLLVIKGVSADSDWSTRSCLLCSFLSSDARLLWHPVCLLLVSFES